MSSYIRPTRRGWLLAFNALLWYMVARGNQNLITLILAWGSLALIVMGFLMAFFALKRIHLRRGPVSDAYMAQLVSLPIICVNPLRRSRQPFIISESLPFADISPHETVVPALASRTALPLQRMVMPVKRGDYRLSEISIHGTDPAGLFLRTRTFQLPAAIIVYPPIFPISNLHLPAPESFQTRISQTSVSVSGDSQDFYGVREYHPSDGMKHIHWRSSAKYGKLMVREYERSASLSIAILLDAAIADVTPKSHANLECLVSLAASLCTYLRPMRCTLSYAAGGRVPVMLEQREISDAFSKTMVEIATIQPGNVTLDEAVETLMPSLAPHTLVFCFSLSDSPQVKTVIEMLRTQGADIRWFMASAKAFLPPRQRKLPKDTTSDFPKQITPEMTSEQIFG